MKIYSEDQNYKLYHGSMLDMLEAIEPNSIDSIITDPPYGLTSITKRFGKENSAPAQYGKDGAFNRLSKGFMGKEWDGSGIEYNIETWQKCYEVLKPGGYLLAFGGSRTYHRIACAIEDAGFEIRDCIMWLYGSGFPKSYNIGKQIEAKVLFNDASGRSQKKLNGKKVEANMWLHHLSYEQGVEKKDYSKLATEKVIDVEYTTDLGKQWQGWGTCLKPAYEPIIIARKPFVGSLVDNVVEYGVGGLNIDECRVGNEIIKGGTMPKMNSQSDGINIYNFGKKNAERLQREDSIGRFPANVILTYDETDFDEVCGGFPNTNSGKMKLNSEVKRKGITEDMPVFNSKNCGIDVNKANGLCSYGDSGSAARYFYCAKASKKDRDEGCDMLNDGLLRRMRPDKDDNNPTGLNKDGKFAPVVRKNTHPTVKPTELMQYLVRLVSPKGSTILDPFMGSGSTGKAVMYENKERNANYKFVGIELTEEYLPIAEARISYANNLTNDDKQMTIFDLEEDNEVLL